MTAEIHRADFGDDALRRFLQAHLDDMAPMTPPESQHALDFAALQAPGVRLWTATLDDALVGTVALAAFADGHEELKSMRTDPTRRGAGIGTALLKHAIRDARERGVSRLSLETGSVEFFAPAHRLYRAHGFVECEPFGSYVLDPHSLFLTRTV